MLIFLNSLWLGILTSISLCHFSNNIVVISYLSKVINNPRKTLLLSFVYTLGRMFFYTSLGMILSFSMNKIGITALFLQKEMNILLGIIMIIIGLIILEVIKFDIKSFSFFDKLKEKFSDFSYIGSFFLGILFASALCPVSAGLFFGNLIQNKGNTLSFLVYGLGTGLPVILTSFILVFSTNKIGKFYNNISIFQKYSTKITGFIFVIAGIFLLIDYLHCLFSNIL